MGSGAAAGSVRARYLVYFQYVGTDFKYVPRPPPGPARRGAPELVPGGGGAGGRAGAGSYI